MRIIYIFLMAIFFIVIVNSCGSDSSDKSTTPNIEDDLCEVTTPKSVLITPNKIRSLWSVQNIKGVSIDTPIALAYEGSKEEIYVAHNNGQVISKLSSDGNISASKSIGSWIVGFNAISSIKTIQNKLYVADSHRVYVFDLSMLLQASINTIALAKTYVDMGVDLNDMAVDAKGNIYLSVKNQNKLYKIDASTAYGVIDLQKDFDVTLYLSNINSLYNADCNIVYGGVGAYLSKLIEGQPAESLVNHSSNTDPVNLTSIDLYNFNDNGNRVYLVADNKSEIKVVYDRNKTIRGLEGGYIGGSDVGRFVFLRSNNILIIPKISSNMLEAYIIEE